MVKKKVTINDTPLKNFVVDKNESDIDDEIEDLGNEKKIGVKEF